MLRSNWEIDIDTCVFFSPVWWVAAHEAAWLFMLWGARSEHLVRIWQALYWLCIQQTYCKLPFCGVDCIVSTVVALRLSYYKMTLKWNPVQHLAWWRVLELTARTKVVSLCESAFFYKKTIKSKYRSTTTDEHHVPWLWANSCIFPVPAVPLKMKNTFIYTLLEFY